MKFSSIHTALQSRACFAQKLDQLSLEVLLELSAQKSEQSSPDLFMNILKKCKERKNPCFIKYFHALIYDSGMEKDTTIGNYIVSVLAECGDVIDGEVVLNRLALRNVYSWTSIISGFLECGNAAYALELYEKMCKDGVYASSYTFVMVLKSCGCLKNAEKGLETHSNIVKAGWDDIIFVGTALVDMYVNTGSLLDAEQVFNKMTVQNVVSLNVLIKGYVDYGFSWKVRACLKQMELKKIFPDMVTFLCCLKSCSIDRALQEGHMTHSILLKKGFESDGYIGNTIVDMYAKCGALLEAYQIFNNLPERNVVSWNALISGYAEYGWVHDVLKYYEQMMIEDGYADAVTFIYALKAYCYVRAIEKVQITYMEITKRAFDADNKVNNTLINVYFESGLLEDGQKVFNDLPIHNVVSWNVLIAGYVESGCNDSALHFYEDMRHAGIVPDVITFASVLKSCGNVSDLPKCQELHASMIKIGLKADLYLSNSLIDVYVKCRLLTDAHKIFDELSDRDVISWTVLFSGYCEYMSRAELFEFFNGMQLEGFSADRDIYSCFLKACSRFKLLETGADIHNEAIKKGYEQEPVLSCGLIDMYVSCGSLLEAQSICDMSPTRDIASWNALIGGFVESNTSDQVEKCLNQIHSEGLSLNSTTFALVLKTCSNCKNVRLGQHMHKIIIEIGLETDSIIGISLTQMYTECAFLADAEDACENMQSVNSKLRTSLATGSNEGKPTEQISEFIDQLQHPGMFQNPKSLASSLEVCTAMKNISKGHELHAQLICYGVENHLMTASALLAMYAKCGLIIDAHKTFDCLSVRDVVLWNIVIAGNLESGSYLVALDCIKGMQAEGHSPSLVTFICALKACGGIGAIEKANEIHNDVVCKGFDLDLFVSNTVIDMYAKCGLLIEAKEVFRKLPVRDAASWNSMIAGYGVNHDIIMAMKTFEDMQVQRVVPDATTFICLLGVCSRLSLIQKGHEYLVMMARTYRIIPSIDHWSCIVDTLARAGAVHEALRYIEFMSCSPSKDMLVALLTACKTCANVDLGFKCFNQLVQINQIDIFD